MQQRPGLTILSEQEKDALIIALYEVIDELRLPPVGLFDRAAAPDDLAIVFAIEALTNDRLRDEAGEISLAPVGDRISGPGTTPIMAAFTHLNPEGSPFTDGSYGAYNAANTIDTAIAET